MAENPRIRHLPTIPTTPSFLSQLLAYADDFDIMVRTTRDVQTAFIQIEQAAQDFGLHINEGKTKYKVAMSAPKSYQPTTSNHTGQTGRIKVADHNFETVDKFSYLGSKITTDNSYDDEIHSRLLSTNKAYLSLQNYQNVSTQGQSSYCTRL